MFSSLRSRLLTTYLVLIGALAALTTLALVVTLLNNPLVHRQTFNRLEEVRRLVERRERTFLAQPRPIEELQAFATRVAEEADVRVLVVDQDGRTLADAPGGPAITVDATTAQAARPTRGVVRDESGDSWLLVARPLPDGQRLILAQPAPRVRVLAVFGDELLAPIGRAALAAACLSLVLAALMARWIAAPLQRLAAAARAVTGRQTPPPLKPEGPTEVRAVTAAFNEMARRVQAVHQSQRDFVANVSHELRTPLTSIGGFAQAVLDGTADSPDAVRRSASVIHAEAERMRRLVEELLDLARLEAEAPDMRREPLTLEPILRAAVEAVRPRAAAAGISLDVRIDKLPLVSGDADRLRQVVDNLLDNAIKHTPSGGRLTLTAAATERGRQIEMVVEDTGVGIPPEDLPRVFERFYRVDKSRPAAGGTGLGLAICKEIVEAHGGSIRVESRVGEGTRVVVGLEQHAGFARR